MKRQWVSAASLSGIWAIIVITARPALAQESAYVYECDNGQTFEVLYANELAVVVLDDAEPLELPQVVSASGARYSDGTTTLSTKGDEAFIEVRGETTFDNCIVAAPTTSEEIEATVVDYECAGGSTFEASYLPETATLTMSNNESLILTRVPSGSGIRYTDGSTTLYSQGNNALVEIDGEVAYSDCVAQETTSISEDAAIAEPSISETNTDGTTTNTTEATPTAETNTPAAATFSATRQTVEPTSTSAPAPQPTPAPAVPALW